MKINCCSLFIEFVKILQLDLITPNSYFLSSSSSCDPHGFPLSVLTASSKALERQQLCRLLVQLLGRYLKHVDCTFWAKLWLPTHPQALFHLSLPSSNKTAEQDLWANTREQLLSNNFSSFFTTVTSQAPQIPQKLQACYLTPEFAKEYSTKSISNVIDRQKIIQSWF